tara:strand:+ start:30305 stop:31006 length:702 start_codon:yes stop_codon:yes gene_type:complete
MRFALVQHLLTVPAAIFAAVIWGVCAVPSYLMFLEIKNWSEGHVLWTEALAICIGLGLGYLLWGLVLLLVCGILGGLLRPPLREGRYPLKSWVTIGWAWSLLFHKVAQMFIKNIVPSLQVNIYYKLMGANIGQGVQILTDSLNDAHMVTLGDGVVVGGNATINGHLVERGEIVLAPVRVGKNAVIGGGSTVQPGCTIGEGAVVASRAVVPKWTDIPAGEAWGGIPAKFIKKVE